VFGPIVPLFACGGYRIVSPALDETHGRQSERLGKDGVERTVKLADGDVALSPSARELEDAQRA